MTAGVNLAQVDGSPAGERGAIEPRQWCRTYCSIGARAR